MIQIINSLLSFLKNQGWILLVLFSVSGCRPLKTDSGKIDRKALVERHNVLISAFVPLAPLTAGNGSFAFTADATGLQTYPELYENGVPLGTQSEWGWHSFPNTGNYKIEESFKYYNVRGRKVPYAVQWEEGRQKDAANYFRQNPHRLHLGIVGFGLSHPDGSEVIPSEITGISQVLDLWKGEIRSKFEIDGTPVEVFTCCHPSRDLISCKVESALISKGQLKVKIRLPYPTGGHSDSGCDWGHRDLHSSEIEFQQKNGAIINHSIDSAFYKIAVAWEGNAVLAEKGSHCFQLAPGDFSPVFSFSVEFSQNKIKPEVPGFVETQKSAAGSWEDFWQSGGAIDCSESTDPRANELERRIVLSQYLGRAQCAGNYPPQETGLTYNSWYGKFHLEMHWWHSIHWALWNRNDLLEKSLGWYNNVIELARGKAKLQGYGGVRWQKMTDPSGLSSPSGVGEFLIWQQPHFIYFAELCYRNDSATLKKYAPLVFATADFMASFVVWDEGRNCFNLSPPLIPAQESLDRNTTYNPPFELAYWHWGLSTAQKWRERMGMDKNPEWQKIIQNLPPIPAENGLYLAAENAADSYTNQKFFSDHPMVLGAYGMLPGYGIDTAVMSNTLGKVEKIWNWPTSWGWDFPMVAMCAARLGQSEKALDFLLMDVPNNRYLTAGQNYRDERLRIYLPGNGGLLAAMAALCAGFEGKGQPVPENPVRCGNWVIRWENLEKMF